MNIIKKIFILPIKIYQWVISPLIGPSCRYDPTCSHYMIHAIEEWGIIKGSWLGIKRIGRCHPWGGHGYDPVPKKSDPAQKSKSNEEEPIKKGN